MAEDCVIAVVVHVWRIYFEHGKGFIEEYQKVILGSI